jgi:alanine dehydrogenase
MGNFNSAKFHGGRDNLLTGFAGVSSALMAGGHKAVVSASDDDLNRVEHMSYIISPYVICLHDDPVTLESELKTTDMVIGAVFAPKAKAPKLIR